VPLKDDKYTPEQLEAVQKWEMPENDEQMEEFLRFGEDESTASQLVAYYRTGRNVFSMDMFDAATYAVYSVLAAQEEEK
jgi:hypothetical protein